MLGRLEVGIFHIGSENPLIRLCADSVESLGYHPVLLTDKKTPSPIDAYRLEVGGELMVQNVSLQLEFLKEYERVLFIDSDILILKDISPVFDRMDEMKCSLGLTWRDKKQFPINYGVIFATRSAVPFFEFILENVKSQPEDRRKWYANQFAVRDLFSEEERIGMGRFERMGRFKIHKTEMGRILMLPGCEYNFSTKEGSKVLDQYIVHFKGDRKPQMGEIHKRLFCKTDL